MKLSAFLTYVFVTAAATVAIWGAFQAAGHRWWSLVYAVCAFALIFGWDSARGFLERHRARRRYLRATAELRAGIEETQTAIGEALRPTLSRFMDEFKDVA